MGKKYLPVNVSGSERKLYLDDIQKIYRSIKKSQKPIPPYSQPILRKVSQRTEGDPETQND